MDGYRRRQLVTLYIVVAYAAVAAVAGVILAAWYAPGFMATVGWRFEPALVEERADREAFLAAISEDDVLRDALRTLGSTGATELDVTDLRGRLQAWLDAGGTDGAQLWLSLRASTPWDAMRAVAAVAGSVEARDRAGAGARAEHVLADLDAAIEALAAEVRAQQVLGGAAGDRVGELVAARGRLIDTRNELMAAVAAGDAPLALGRVAPIRWSPAPTLVVAAAAAALIGGLTGFVSHRSSARGRRGAGLRSRGAGAVPHGAPLAVFPRPRMDHDPVSFEAANRLRVRVLSMTAQVRPRVLMVSGAHDTAGAADVATLLAEELAYQGARTLLVDGVIYAPSLAARYGVEEEPDGVGGDGPWVATTLAWLQHPTGPHHLVTIDVAEGRTLDLVPQFRPARPAPGTAPTLFAGFGEALQRWVAYDTIVVHGPPLEAVEDGRLLAAFATGVVLVTDSGGLDRRSEQRLARIIRGAGSLFLGTAEVEADGSGGATAATGRRSARAATRPRTRGVTPGGARA